MARLTVLVDGVTKYDADVPDTYLPQQADMMPTALGLEKRPGPAPPLARIFLIGILGPALAGWIEHQPLLQPVEAACQMDASSGGFTLTVSGPPISLDDVRP